MGNVACGGKGDTEEPRFNILPNKLNDRNMDIQLETMGSQKTELNEFIKINKVNAKRIYRHFDLDALNDFVHFVKEKGMKENKPTDKFILKEDQESNGSEEFNTRPGMFYKYFGEVHPESNERHGLGFGVWADGSSYHGEWVKDKKNGEGIEDWLDGAKYEGCYKEGLKHGNGRFGWPNDDVYVGEFKNNHIEGKGLYEWSDGKSYDGEWINNKMHGKGKFSWADGKFYIGEYVNDNREGTGTFYWRDGSKYEGQWVNGKQNGRGTHTNAAGVSKEGEWRDGVEIKAN